MDFSFAMNEWLSDSLLPTWSWIAILCGMAWLIAGLRRRRRKPRVPVVEPDSPLLEPGVILPYRSSLPQLASELARARRYQYPLTIVILRLDEDQLLEKGRGMFSMKKTEPGLVNLLNAFVGSLLRASLRDIDVVSFDVAKNQYILLLPETTMAKAERPVLRLNGMCMKQTGVSMMVGIAEFPEDGLIIEDLVSSAEAGCNRTPANENSRGVFGKEKQRSHSAQSLMP